MMMMKKERKRQEKNGRRSLKNLNSTCPGTRHQVRWLRPFLPPKEKHIIAGGAPMVRCHHTYSCKNLVPFCICTQNKITIFCSKQSIIQQQQTVPNCDKVRIVDLNIPDDCISIILRNLNQAKQIKYAVSESFADMFRVNIFAALFSG